MQTLCREHHGVALGGAIGAVVFCALTEYPKFRSYVSHTRVFASLGSSECWRGLWVAVSGGLLEGTPEVTLLLGFHLLGNLPAGCSFASPAVAGGGGAGGTCLSAPGAPSGLCSSSEASRPAAGEATGCDPSPQ